MFHVQCLSNSKAYYVASKMAHKMSLKNSRDWNFKHVCLQFKRLSFFYHHPLAHSIIFRLMDQSAINPGEKVPRVHKWGQSHFEVIFEFLYTIYLRLHKSFVPILELEKKASTNITLWHIRGIFPHFTATTCEQHCTAVHIVYGS